MTSDRILCALLKLLVGWNSNFKACCPNSLTAAKSTASTRKAGKPKSFCGREQAAVQTNSKIKREDKTPPWRTSLRRKVQPKNTEANVLHIWAWPEERGSGGRDCKWLENISYKQLQNWERLNQTRSKPRGLFSAEVVKRNSTGAVVSDTCATFQVYRECFSAQSKHQRSLLMSIYPASAGISGICPHYRFTALEASHFSTEEIAW